MKRSKRRFGGAIVNKSHMALIHKRTPKIINKHAQYAVSISKRVVLATPRLGRRAPEEALEQAIQTIPRITNETVAEHREAVIGSARKYIYPLRHSTNRIVLISVGLFAGAVVTFFGYCLLALYKFQSTSSFVYDVTQVVPFPIAKAGTHFISYESYLFEVRHYIHYYQTQQNVDFSSLSGKQQLAQFRQQALNEVIEAAYVKQLARQNDVVVTDNQLNNEITLLQQQNRLGSSNRVFADVLKEFWGWSINDFRRELQQQMLAQNVVSKLDPVAHKRAQNVLSQLKSGGDFASLAKQYSDDASTSGNGGAYGFSINKQNQNVSPQVVNALYGLRPGQISGIINTGSGLEIEKVTAVNGDEIQASHIYIAFNSIDMYIAPLRAKEAPHFYIHT
ncbi:MAG TPA: peptidylprolyl isomerase [Candidatus Saccharimonadales bacterium]|nr:peptidylprolyl isomerase [Candidatus Saccharimonadales bacterium]